MAIQQINGFKRIIQSFGENEASIQFNPDQGTLDHRIISGNIHGYQYDQPIIGPLDQYASLPTVGEVLRVPFCVKIDASSVGNNAKIWDSTSFERDFIYSSAAVVIPTGRIIISGCSNDTNNYAQIRFAVDYTDIDGVHQTSPESSNFRSYQKNEFDLSTLSLKSKITDDIYLSVSTKNTDVGTPANYDYIACGELLIYVI